MNASARTLRWVAIISVMSLTPVWADVETRVASYESSETDLTVTAHAGDAGLTVSIVTGGVGGAPAASDGSQMLRLDIVSESDRKVEFRHNWSTTTYDLNGAGELLADIYVQDAGAVPGLVGIFSTNWNPPGAWQPAAGIPTNTGSWITVSFDVSARSQTGVSSIHAFVLQDLAGTSGVVFIDNLRLRSGGPLSPPEGLAAVGLADRNALAWKPADISNLDGYHVYRASGAVGPYSRITPTSVSTASFEDPGDPDRPLRFYRVSAVADGTESGQSDVASASYNGLSDEALLDLVQERTFRYFWDYGHPHSGMAREGMNFGHPLYIVTTGGTGMGLMSIVVGAERGLVTRAAAADRILRIVRFLDGVDPDDPGQSSGVSRYHGAWSHWMHGQTGATIAFAGQEDNGGDLVETAFLVQGLLTVRQYFDNGSDAVESEIVSRCTSMWLGVEWDWYQRFPGSGVLYWHWSPNFGWALNHQIRGYNEAQIVYLLAIASPTYPVPASFYTSGWTNTARYVNGNTHFGYVQSVGEPLGGPLFFTHYSNLGFDPRYKRDAFANYFDNARNISLINRAYCIDNPGEHEGYSPLLWGLTASFNPWGYLAHSPTNDNGTVTPTAAISAMPYTPEESLRTMRYLYDTFGEDLFGPYGFYDALNLGADWFASGYIAIDQGTIMPMIENYRSGLCWRLFMANPEILPMMTAIGMYHEIDVDRDGDVDVADVLAFLSLWFAGSMDADYDGSGMVDVGDLLSFLSCWFTAIGGGVCS